MSQKERFSSVWEEKIYRHDPLFYDQIKSEVPHIPDERPKETLKQFMGSLMRKKYHHKIIGD